MMWLVTHVDVKYTPNHRTYDSTRTYRKRPFWDHKSPIQDFGLFLRREILLDSPYSVAGVLGCGHRDLHHAYRKG